MEKRRAQSAVSPAQAKKQKAQAAYNSDSDDGSESELEVDTSAAPVEITLATASKKKEKMKDASARKKEDVSVAKADAGATKSSDTKSADDSAEIEEDSIKDRKSNKQSLDKSGRDVQNTISSGTGKGRAYTVSIALPGSIVANAQSPELKTYLAGQVARAVTVFEIDEVVIFNEDLKQDAGEPTKKKGKEITGQFEGATIKTDPNLFLARVLQYLETPQYLRKAFFPVHRDLTYAGLLNPLDAPHHMRKDAVAHYREGVTLARPVKKGQGSLVDCGMWQQVKIDRHIQPGVRVTVKMQDPHGAKPGKHPKGTVVKPSAPREEAGLYWGYTTRIANTMADIWSECPYKEGYDLTVGTSENGENIHELELPQANHILIVFGGLAGLESALDVDHSLGSAEAPDLFDYYVNTCPNQGSRTIRTEEAILVTMSALRSKINNKHTGLNTS